MAEDYYQILGVSKTATKEQIKKAYKKMALKHHPDKNRGDKKSEEAFKKINEAYAVLSDDEKRRQYDLLGTEGFSNRFSQEDIFQGFDIGSIFNEFGFGGDNIFSRFFGGGNTSEGKSPFSFSFGGAPFGNNDHTTKSHPRHHQAKHQDTKIKLSLSFEEAINGGKKAISFNSGKGIDKIILAIPPGIETGKKLKVKGKGAIDPMTGMRGDLYCQISIVPHKYFKRDGIDLILEKEVRLTELIMGGKISITTLDRKKIELTIPPHTQNNSYLRVKGKGIHLKNKTPGNLFVKLTIKLPKTLTNEQKDLIQQLQDTGL